MKIVSIPGYREAVERENAIRDLAFLPMPVRICGIEVVPMTLRHVLLLDGVASPFVTHGVEPDEIDVARFFWILSPRFSTDSRLATRLRRWLCYQRCRKLKLREAADAIFQFCDDSFQDSPERTPRRVWRAPVFSIAAGLVDRLAFNYGWSEETILSLPVTRLFQYIRTIRNRTENRPVFCNRSDKVRGDWMRQRRGERNSQDGIQ